MEALYIGEIGKPIVMAVKNSAGTALPLSPSDILTIIIRKANGTTISRSAQIKNDGSDGLMEYLIAVDDFVPSDGGTCTVWGKVKWAASGKTNYTRPQNIQVMASPDG